MLFFRDRPWVKKQHQEFDVGMGSFDGAEVSGLVALYMLHLIHQHQVLLEGSLASTVMMAWELPPSRVNS